MTRTIARALACALLAVSSQLAAQQYPASQISMIVPLAAGDASDTAARAIGEALSKDLKVPVVVMNRPGVGGALGTDLVVKGAKDGSLIGTPNNAALIYRAIMDPANTTYDPVKDLVPLALAMRSPSILAVGADQPFKTFQEMVDYSKKNPGKVRIGTAGVGSVGDFCVRQINALTGAGLTMVPFQGAMPAVTAMRGSHIEGVVLALGTMTAHLQSGAVRGMVISSKWPDYASIPTMQDLGFKDPLFGIWTAFFAPAGMPADATKVLVPALERAIRSPEIIARLKPLGILADYSPPEKLLAEMKDEQQRVLKMAQAAGLIKK